MGDPRSALALLACRYLKNGTLWPVLQHLDHWGGKAQVHTGHKGTKGRSSENGSFVSLGCSHS